MSDDFKRPTQFQVDSNHLVWKILLMREREVVDGSGTGVWVLQWKSEGLRGSSENLAEPLVGHTYDYTKVSLLNAPTPSLWASGRLQFDTIKVDVTSTRTLRNLSEKSRRFWIGTFINMIGAVSLSFCAKGALSEKNVRNRWVRQ